MQLCRLTFLVSVGLLLVATGLLATDTKFHPHHLIVKFKQQPKSLTSYTASGANGIRDIIPLFEFVQKTRIKNSSLSSVYLFIFTDAEKRLLAENSLANDVDIEYVEPDYKVELFNDPLLSHQWALANTGQEYYGIDRIEGSYNDTLMLKRGVPGADINWPDSAVAATDRHQVVLAIIDTGIDYLHPDLAANIWTNDNEIPDNGLDDDFNGLIDDYYGYDFSGDESGVVEFIGDSDPRDQVGHGTHVAGIAAAVAGNGIGVAGVARNVRVMGIKMFPNAFASVVSPAIVYAVENGAAVINASWGTPYYSSIIKDAVKYADSAGVLVVAAAGNSGESSVFYPAKIEEIITVGASNSADLVTGFSTYGDWIDLVAPGQDILSLRAAGTDLYESIDEPGSRIIDSIYYLADGTSMSAPHVCGAAAFILSLSAGLSTDSLKKLLTGTADDLVDPYGDGDELPGWDIYSGYGRLNLGRAVSLLSGDYAEIEQPRFGSIESGLITFVGSAVSQSGEVYRLEVRPASLGEWITIANSTANIIRQPLAEWNSSDYDGRTEVRLSIGLEITYHSEIRLVNNNHVEIIYPQAGDTVFSAASIIGSASAPGFAGYKLSYYTDAAPAVKNLIETSTKLVYREIIADWQVGPIRPGTGTLRLSVTINGQVFEDEVHIVTSSLIATGYPIDYGSRPNLSSTVGNVDYDPYPEIVTGSYDQITVNHYHEGTIDVLTPDFGTSFYSAIALFDLNDDGRDEIIAVTDQGVIVLTGAGDMLPGWPKSVSTGHMYNSLPTPLVTDLDGDGDAEILFVNQGGEIYCWHHNGASYFNTTGGFFGTLYQGGRYRTFGGHYVPYLFAYDFDGDGYQDVGVLFSSYGTRGGIYLLSGKNGQALYKDKGIKVQPRESIFGGLLADFDGDDVPEIAFTYWYGGADFLMGVTICEADGTPLPGWPKHFEQKTQWLSPYPAAADLDADSLPELICVFSAMDGAEVYVWHGDGTPFLESDFGANDGLLAAVPTSLASPLVVDVDDDRQLEIVSRGGALFWGKHERVFAWELDGSLCHGWPLYTYANPATVTYAPFTPLVGDFDLDDRLEMMIGSSDAKVYCWELPTKVNENSTPWGQFLHDSQHTGTLPIIPRTDKPQPPPLPEVFALRQNYPNPFNGSTIITIDLKSTGRLTLEVFNILGERVMVLYDREIDAGTHPFRWDGRNDTGDQVASGVYLYRMKTGNLSETRKMLYLK